MGVKIDLEEEFLSYCFSGKLSEVRACLTLKADVNAKSEDGFWTALTIAVHMIKPELLEILLSHPNIDVNLTASHVCRKLGNIYQWTPLMFACFWGHSTMVARLAKVPGLNIKYRDNFGDTAAHKACERGHTECVRILAGAGGVDWNGGNRRGQTPLFLAVDAGHAEIVKIIVKQPNINYYVKSDNGQTLVEVAINRGDQKCLEILASQRNCSGWTAPDKNGDIPVMMALKTKKIEIVKYLVTLPQVQVALTLPRDRAGWSLISRAISIKQLDLVKKILVSMNQKVSGSSLARIAVEVGKVEDVRLLAQSGTVDWNEAAKDEDPAIMWALKNRKLKIVQILLTCPGIETNIRDRNKQTLAKIARDNDLGEILENIPETTEYKLRKLKESLQVSQGLLLNERIPVPECRVCLEKFQRDGQIFCCSNGHFLCGPCKTLGAIQVCPKCKSKFAGRAHDFEKVVNSMWE